MYRFEFLNAFYLFVVVFVILFFYLLFSKYYKKTLISFASSSILSQILVKNSPAKRKLKFILTLVAMVLMIFAIANLQVAGKLKKTAESKTIDLILAIDISHSMLAEDIKPNRLERAKMFALNLVDKVKFAKVGIVVFSGDAYTHLPVTSDKGAVRMFLQSITTNLISRQGTAIGKAIEIAINTFNSTQTKNRTIVILTDGENFEDDPLEYAREAAKDEIKIHTVVFGTPEGGPIPIKEKDKIVGFKKDAEGNTVITKPDFVLLKDIATTTNGVYVDGSQITQAINSLNKEFEKMEKEKTASLEFADYQSLFRIFAIPSLILLIIDFLISERHTAWQSKLKSLLSISLKRKK